MAYKNHHFTMKKKFLFSFLLVSLLSVCVLTSCSKDDDDSFAYPLEQLYGKWKATSVYSDGTWYDVTRFPYTKFGMDITFYEGGKFYGSGYLGNGSGTYTLKGKTITTYINGKEYIVYTVTSLTGTQADLTMSQGGESLRIKAEKEY